MLEQSSVCVCVCLDLINVTCLFYYQDDEPLMKVTQEDPLYLKFTLRQGLYIMYYQSTVTDLNTGLKSMNCYVVSIPIYRCT